MNAVYEIDQLARVMPGLIPIDDDQKHYAIRGLCARILRLTGVLMDCVPQSLPPSFYDESDVRNALLLTENAQG